jgi:hypothetical protein
MSDPSQTDDTATSDVADDTLIGEYANYVSVSSTQTEFYIDFMLNVPAATNGGEDQVLAVRRIMISPMLVRGLIKALEQEASSYESTFTIMLPTVGS